MYLASREDIKVIVVTGPGEGEGKSTTTANLATALAQAGKRVVVISADLRKPRLHRFFDQSNDVGLTEVLEGSRHLRDVVRSTSLPTLKVIASGSIPPNPAELLSSPAMDEVIESLRAVADFVLFDTTPSLVVADALELAPKVDGIVVVVDGSKTTRQAATHLRHQLERVGGLIVGGVLNNLDPGQEVQYGRYYRSKGDSYRKPTKRARKARGANDAAGAAPPRRVGPHRAAAARALERARAVERGAGRLALSHVRQPRSMSPGRRSPIAYEAASRPSRTGQ